METSLDSDTKPNGPNMDKSLEKFSDDEANATQNLVTSESKTPLKTPLKEGDSDVQVKFIVNDSVNGDAKIDIDNVKSAFAGMAKEELMKYANDPFWIRTRLILFIFFWVVWIAMFVGAIAIIVMAPRCVPPKRPTWFQEGPLYEVDVKKFGNNPSSKNPFQDLISKLDYLSTLKIKGLILNQLFKSIGDEENVVDFKVLNDEYGSTEDLKNLVKESKDKGIHLIMSFVPNHSSDKHPWFKKSVANETAYRDYYVWSKTPGGKDIPPNNWKSLYNQSAWTWNEQRQAFYLHQFGENQPDLNFRNKAVLKEFNETLSFWLDMGISGFNMEKAQYLLEDPNLENEERYYGQGGQNFVHTEYGFYEHRKTYNLPGTAKILSTWRDIIRQKTNEDGVLMITGKAPIPSDSNETTTTTVVDLARSEKLKLKPNFTAKELADELKKISNNSESWPTIQIGGKNSLMADVYGKEYVDGLNMISLILNATMFTYFGDEIGLTKNNSFPVVNGSKLGTDEDDNRIKIYQVLAKEKGEVGLLHGNSSVTVLNGTVVAVTRIKQGSPGYLVVFNLSENNTTISLNEIKNVPDEVGFLVKSMNYDLRDFSDREKIKSNDFTLAPRSSVAFTFAPEKSEE